MPSIDLSESVVNRPSELQKSSFSVWDVRKPQASRLANALNRGCLILTFPSPNTYSESQRSKEPSVLATLVPLLQCLLHLFLRIFSLADLLEGVI